MRNPGNLLPLRECFSATVKELEDKLEHPTEPVDASTPWSSAHLQKLIEELPNVTTQHKFRTSLDWSRGKHYSKVLKETILKYYAEVRDLRARECGTCLTFGILDPLLWQHRYGHKGTVLKTDFCWSKTKSKGKGKRIRCVRCTPVTDTEPPAASTTPKPPGDELDMSSGQTPPPNAAVADLNKTTPADEIVVEAQSEPNESTEMTDTEPPAASITPKPPGDALDMSSEQTPPPDAAVANLNKTTPADKIVLETQSEPNESLSSEPEEDGNDSVVSPAAAQSKKVVSSSGVDINAIRLELVRLRVGGVLLESIDRSLLHNDAVENLVIESAQQLLQRETEAVLGPETFSGLQCHGDITRLGVLETERLNAPLSSSQRHVLFGHLDKVRGRNLKVRRPVEYRFMFREQITPHVVPLVSPLPSFASHVGRFRTPIPVFLLAGLHGGHMYRN
jgi:hypothetical protein